MQSQNVVILTGDSDAPDVGTPQAANLVRLTCHSVSRSGMVALGRAKSAVFNNLVPGVSDDNSGPQEGWSRGCRRAESFWSWLWSPLWLLALRKKKLSWSSRSRSSPSTPASTSNNPERARRHALTGPASLPPKADCAWREDTPQIHQIAHWAYRPFAAVCFPALEAAHTGFAAAPLCRIRPARCIDRSKDRC